MKKLYKRRRLWVYSDEREAHQVIDYIVSENKLEDQKGISKADLICNDKLVDHYDTYLFINHITEEDIKVLNKYGLISEL